MKNIRDNDSRSTTLKALSLANEKKAVEPVILEVGKITYLADYFLILTGNNAQHLQTLADNIRDGLKKAGLSLLRLEGHRDARWILMDYGSLIIHIFQPAEREFYNLERLWRDAKRVDLAAEGLAGPSDFSME